MNLKKKVASLVAALSLLANTAVPALALTVTIDGNLSNSDNYVNLDLDKKVDVDQNNNADVNNSVTVSTNTGTNKVKDVAGGNVEVDTGDTETGVAVQNTLNTNAASVAPCGGCALDGDFKISNNASNTDNDIKVDLDQNTYLDQDNDANVKNDLDVTSNSGKNSVKDVTGGAMVSIDTGKVVVNPVIVKNTLNQNYAVVGGGDSEGGLLSAWIVGNLSKSQNFIDLDLDNKTDLDQENDADVSNDVTVYGDSGLNSIKDIAGAMATVDTGDVEVGVLVDTVANFNTALVSDCCVMDIQAGIKNNASKTDNDIALDLNDKLYVDQDNDLDCSKGYGLPELFLLDFFGRGKSHGSKDCNDVDVSAYTGDNLVKDSTSGDDPSVDTGDASVGVEVKNSGNVNEFGSGDFDLPGNGGGANVSVNLDFGEVLDLLHQILNSLS